ncbi:MAG: TetR/AcrR family transcriptional regulator [Thermoanaerobaculia bacterium]
MPRTLTETKRADILTAATVVFARKGFHEVRTDEIAAEACVGKGTLYRYFPTKDDLFYSAVLAGFDEMDAVLEALRAREDPPAATLAKVARQALRIFWSRPSFNMVLHPDTRRFRIREREVKKRREALVKFVRETIARGVALGDFRPVDPRVSAEIFLGMLRGLLFHRNESDSPAALVRTLTDTFLSGIGRRKEAS